MEQAQYLPGQCADVNHPRILVRNLFIVLTTFVYLLSRNKWYSTIGTRQIFAWSMCWCQSPEVSGKKICFFVLTPFLNVSERKNTSVRRALFHKCLFRRTTPFLDRRHINMYHVSPVYLYFTFFSSKTFRASPHLQLHLNSANVFVFNWQFYKVSETCFLQGPNSVARHNVVCSSFVKDCSSDWMFWRKFNFQSL